MLVVLQLTDAVQLLFPATMVQFGALIEAVGVAGATQEDPFHTSGEVHVVHDGGLFAPLVQLDAFTVIVTLFCPLETPPL